MVSSRRSAGVVHGLSLVRVAESNDGANARSQWDIRLAERGDDASLDLGIERVVQPGGREFDQHRLPIAVLEREHAARPCDAASFAGQRDLLGKLTMHFAQVHNREIQLGSVGVSPKVVVEVPQGGQAGHDRCRRRPPDELGRGAVMDLAASRGRGCAHLVKVGGIVNREPGLRNEHFRVVHRRWMPMRVVAPDAQLAAVAEQHAHRRSSRRDVGCAQRAIGVGEILDRPVAHRSKQPTRLP